MQRKYRLAISMIREFEGFHAEPYVCPAGVLTIGWGRTELVMPGDVTTKLAEAEWLLDKVKDINDVINQVVNPYQTPEQMAALISFSYNVGTSALRRSTLVKRINSYDSHASDEFLRWVKANGLTLPGLVRRRRAEKSLYDSVI